MVTLLDVELGDLDAALKSATAGYSAAVATKDMPILAGNGTATARLALAYDRCEDAAELLGAAARVRGIEDPTDPTIAELFATLPAGWAARRSPPHTTGAGRAPRRTRRSGSTPRHWT